MPDWLNIPVLREKGQLLFEQAVTIWVSGGWAMVGIAAIALLMFGLGMHIQLKLRAKGFISVPEKKWRQWIDHPEQRRGPIGDILDFVTGSDDLKLTGTYFQEIRSTELSPFTRDLRVMKICVSAAPLLGLLGTVTGMLSTFGALATGSGGDQTMDRIAAGISEALVTTETGLIIALPGLFFQYQLTRKYERYKAFLAHLETVCTQQLYQRMHDAPMEKPAMATASSVAPVHVETEPTTGAPGGSGSSDARDAPDKPGASGAPDAFDAPDTTDASDATGASDVPREAAMEPSDGEATPPATEATTSIADETATTPSDAAVTETGTTPDNESAGRDSKPDTEAEGQPPASVGSDKPDTAARQLSEGSSESPEATAHSTDHPPTDDSPGASKPEPKSEPTDAVESGVSEGEPPQREGEPEQVEDKKAGADDDDAETNGDRETDFKPDSESDPDSDSDADADSNRRDG